MHRRDRELQRARAGSVGRVGVWVEHSLSGAKVLSCRCSRAAGVVVVCIIGVDKIVGRVCAKCVLLESEQWGGGADG